MTACEAAEPWTPRLPYVWSGSGFGQGPRMDSASAAPSGRSGAGMSRTWWARARVRVPLLPLTMIVLLAMGVPTNIAGWGPREGVAAWAFGAASPGHDEPAVRPTHAGPSMRPEWVQTARWRTPATAEPKGATRG